MGLASCWGKLGIASRHMTGIGHTDLLRVALRVLMLGLNLALVAVVSSALARAADEGGAARPVGRELPTDPQTQALVADLVAAGRILADQGVLDGFGHVSVRDPHRAGVYLMSRSRAPALVKKEDILEHDLDSNPLDGTSRDLFLERFIHGQIYKARPDVMAVIHSHSPTVIPFSVTQVPLKPVAITAGFLYGGVPVFDVRDHGIDKALLISNNPLGAALAKGLGERPVVLIRGHGTAVVGPTVRRAVLRAIYTEVNARLQQQAMALGGPVTYLAADEAWEPSSLERQWEVLLRQAHQHGM